MEQEELFIKPQFTQQQTIKKRRIHFCDDILFSVLAFLSRVELCKIEVITLRFFAMVQQAFYTATSAVISDDEAEIKTVNPSPPPFICIQRLYIGEDKVRQQQGVNKELINISILIFYS